MKMLLTGAAFAAALLVAGAASASTNLVVNGDFSAGNTGFTSGYTFVPYPTDMHPEGLYTVGPNPFAVHSSWINLDDGNNRLIVNGATTAPLPFVWREDVAAAAGGYNFSMDAANICCNSSYSGPNLPSLLTFQYSSDGGTTFNPLGVLLTMPPSDAGVFHSISGSFVLPTTGTLRLQIGSGTDFAGGNDFAIDNIVVQGVPEPASWALMITGFGLAGAALRRRRRPLAVAA
ncbi:MAG: PEPxxWA-CTERM sorting domain-containing protein [Caulobacterales bacterium]|jgi:hypothetical protein